MSGILTPGERPDPWNIVGDHHRRIRALEAVPPGNAEDSGLQFTTNDPDSYGPVNDGDSLHVISRDNNATSSELFPTTFGQVYESFADDGNIQISTYGADSGIYLHSLQDNIQLSAAADITLSASGNTFIDAVGHVIIAAANDTVQVRIWPTYSVDFLEQNSGTLIARLDYDGDLHLKAGATIIYDL